ncbi:MAG: hypothetical protein PVF22_03800 [Candidatus Aminicenantes bacterium]|jgi:hypothetical protein
MKKTLPVLFCLCLIYLSCAPETKVIEPTADFSLNFCNFPHAWTVSRGAGINVGIVSQSEEDSFKWDRLVQKCCPESTVSLFSKAAFLESEQGIFEQHILF